MTFIKFLVWKIKNTSSNYWTLLLLKIFVRLFGMFTIFYALNFMAKSEFRVQQDYYSLVSSLFYILFFVFLDSIIKVSAAFSLSEKIIKPLNMLRWVPLLMIVYLLYSSVIINQIALNAIDFSTPSFLYNIIIPLLIIPNLSYIIITILIFYSSAILNRNKKLKEENDLTI
jgi:hypothetical protein